MDFAELLTDLADGSINRDLGERFARIVEAVEETGNAGKMTITVSVKKEGKMAVVDVSANDKIPSHPMHGTLFFFAGDGSLSRKDPRQMELRNLADAPKASPNNLRTFRGGDDA